MPTEERRCRRFEQGLHPDIFKGVVTHRYRTWFDLLEAARRLEYALALTRHSGDSGILRRSQSMHSETSTAGAKRPRGADSGPVYQRHPSHQCTAHLAPTGSAGGSNAPTPRPVLICYRCLQTGHRASECTQPRPSGGTSLSGNQ